MKKLSFFGVLISITLLFSCDGGKKPKDDKPVKPKEVVKIIVPDFNIDSAYQYIVDQVNFSPRVPNTKAHKVCSDYLVEKLNAFTTQVNVQHFKSRAYDGTILNGKNIIASFNTEAKARILLSAHWDSRPYADHDPDIKNHNTPIDGANDGASGVGVLLEVARQLSINKPSVGVDIILFDAEDYGEPQSSQTGKEDTWCLGSQYWSKNPHITGYKARFGILLDMVGAANATFTKETNSMRYAADIVDKVWGIAQKIGHSQYFINDKAGYITDDHIYVNEIANIPMIDIIHINPITYSFFQYWHTVKDNIDVIDKYTLKAVGETVMTVISLEK